MMDNNEKRIDELEKQVAGHEMNLVLLENYFYKHHDISETAIRNILYGTPAMDGE